MSKLLTTPLNCAKLICVIGFFLNYNAKIRKNLELDKLLAKIQDNLTFEME